MTCRTLLVASRVRRANSVLPRCLTTQPPQPSPATSQPPPQAPTPPKKPKDAFRGMPSSNLPMPGLLFLLTLVIAHHAYEDWTRVDEEPEETPEEKAARALKVPDDDIERLMPDGRVLLKDGSIRKL